MKKIIYAVFALSFCAQAMQGQVVSNGVWQSEEVWRVNLIRPSLEIDKTIDPKRADIQEIFSGLCEVGALDDVRRLVQYDTVSVNKADSKGIMPITYACRSGNLSLVQFLIHDCKADVCLFNMQSRRSALYDACISRYDINVMLTGEIDQDKQREAMNTPEYLEKARRFIVDELLIHTTIPIESFVLENIIPSRGIIADYLDYFSDDACCCSDTLKYVHCYATEESASSAHDYEHSFANVCLILAIAQDNLKVFKKFEKMFDNILGTDDANDKRFNKCIDKCLAYLQNLFTLVAESSSPNIIKYVAEFVCEKFKTERCINILETMKKNEVGRSVINANCYDLASLICLRTGTYREIRNNYFKIGDFKRARNDHYIKLYNFIQQNLPNDDLRMYSQNPTIFMSAECIVSLESKIFAIEQRTYPSLFVDELPEANDTLKARSNAIVPILMEETWTKLLTIRWLV